jgi:peroxiredoxin
MRQSLVLVACLLTAVGGCAAPAGLAIGAKAPEFALPGTDGRKHTLADYAASPVLAVVFTCNRCPEAQRYEARLQRLYAQFAPRGLALVAINPNNPEAVMLADLVDSDVGESLDDMRTRAEVRGLTYVYLSDAKQTAAAQFHVVATPQIFVFDRDRTLRYRGRIDDNAREPLATTPDAANAIEALLAGRPVPVAETRADGCPVLTAPSGPASDSRLAAFERAPVTLDLVGPVELQALRKNGTGRLLLVNFWATWCAPCVTEFPELVTTARIYEPRQLSFVTVSVNDPAERPQVLAFLQQHHASGTNHLFGTADVYGLQAAFDPDLPAPVPFTLLLGLRGEVLYQELGPANVPRLRRAILANTISPADADRQTYWAAGAK